MRDPQVNQRSSTTIMVVEDDAAIRDALATMLQLEGWSVIACESGEHALEQLAQTPVDLIVLDLALPGISGFDICAQLRDESDPGVPIVMLTAMAQPQHVVRGLELGADDYITKPFQPRELLLRINRLLRRRFMWITSQQLCAELSAQVADTLRHLEMARSETTIERTLRSELLHNVTTHMRTLSGVADLTTRRMPEGPLREHVEQLRSRIRSASLVYEISELLKSDPIEVGNLVRTIASALKTLYRPRRRVVVTVWGSEVWLPVSVASPLAIIVNELVTNCFRHGFGEMRFGKVSLTYSADTDTFSLDVTDDGVGFDVARPSVGRGLATVTALVTELGGTVEWRRAEPGTAVRVRLPLRQPADQTG